MADSDEKVVLKTESWTDLYGDLHVRDLNAGGSVAREVVYEKKQFEEGAIRDWLISQGWYCPGSWVDADFILSRLRQDPQVSRENTWVDDNPDTGLYYELNGEVRLVINYKDGSVICTGAGNWMSLIGELRRNERTRRYAE